MFNNATIQGRMVADPEFRQTPNGRDVSSFRMACDRSFADANGNRETDFIDFVAWGKTAEFVSKWFRKGDMALVSGRIQVRGYEDRDGNKRKAFEIVCSSVDFCGGGKKDSHDQGSGYNRAPASSQGGSRQTYAHPSSNDFTEIDDGEDLPF